MAEKEPINRMTPGPPTGQPDRTPGAPEPVIPHGTSPGQQHAALPAVGAGASPPADVSAEGKAQDVKQQVKAEAHGAAEQAKQVAREKAHEVRDRAHSMANEQKDRAAGKLHDVSEALRSASDACKERQDDRMGHYAAVAADKVDEFSTTLRERDVNALVEKVEDFARRRPEVFLGTAFIGGLAMARFLRSSARHTHEAESAEPAPLVPKTTVQPARVPPPSATPPPSAPPSPMI